MIKRIFTQSRLRREASLSCELLKSQQVRSLWKMPLQETNILQAQLFLKMVLQYLFHTTTFGRNGCLIRILKTSAFNMHDSHDDQDNAEKVSAMGIFLSVLPTCSSLIDILYWIHVIIFPFFQGIPLSVFCFHIYTVSLCVLLQPSASLPVMLCAHLRKFLSTCICVFL